MIDNKSVVQEIEAFFSKTGYPPEFLADYDQLECLASHNGRETFLVTKKETQELYIAKCYDTSLFSEPNTESILRNLHHEGIPDYCASYRNDSMFIFVRSYIKGTPLSDYARENDLSQEEIIRLCVKLADILIYLHHQMPPVIHRDIKPENIIITEKEEVFLIDFDIARTFKATEETDTIFFGTKGYAPPEQYGFTQTDSRSDIYSFGVLLRFLLTDSVRANSKIRLYTPLKIIIDRCTAFAPENRYSDMTQVKRALLHANPRSQALIIGKILICTIAVPVVLFFAGRAIYKQITYNPFADSTVIPRVMPDEERQREAVTYLHDKYGTNIFDNRSEHYTVGMLKNTLIEVYGMESNYVRIPSALEPPQENASHFLPWSLDDMQFIDRDYLAYFVTKTYWPEVVADWSSIKGYPEEYPGITVSMKWCEDHAILTGVNRPRDVSCGEAAVAFANADKVYAIIKDDRKK